MAGNSRERGRSVTSRALSILGAFDVDHARLTLSDIARSTGLPIGTAHRLVLELTEWNALERDGSGHYRIGRRLWEIGLLNPLSARLREIAVPFMQSLYEDTRENVHLAVRDGYDALYVDRLCGHKSVPIISHTGSRLPLHATGVGKALLAFSEPEFLRDFLRQPLTRPTGYSIVEPGRLRREISTVRRRGYAVTSEEMTLGSCSVAAPVLDAEGTALAAVGVVVHTTRAEPARLAPPVEAAAKGIAARLAETDDEACPTSSRRDGTQLESKGSPT